MEWHDANISKFVETWKHYVDPTGSTAGRGAAARAGPNVCGLDTTLPE